MARRAFLALCSLLQGSEGGKCRIETMKNIMSNTTARVLRGETYSNLNRQPQAIFGLGESLLEKLEEFAWTREHLRVITPPPPRIEGKVERAKRLALDLTLTQKGGRK